jgi:outer membrane protein insertion porin family
VQQDISALLRTLRFLDVRAEPGMVDGKLRLVFTVVEKPEVSAIEFVGAREFKPKDLLEELTFAVGDPLDMYDVRMGRETIERLYKEKGYAYVQVTYDEDALKNEQRVVYVIVENQRIRVRKVIVEGNVTYSDGELKRQIQTKKYIPVFRTGDFDPDRAERDGAALQKYYRDRGFLDAEVGHVVEFEDVARDKLRVVFRVNEGTRYTVSEIRIEGNTVFSDEELLAKMLLKAGDYFLAARLINDAKALRTLYGSQGYIYARVVPSRPVFADEPGQVFINIAIEEGQQFHIGWIEVNGNFQTQEKCVRRELRFYPEEIYDTTKTQAAEQRLRETGLFTAATTIEPTGDQPGIRDVLVNVEESEKTSMFIAGIGAGSDSGVLGNITLENRNFDIFDTPRSWKEFFKGKAFRGAGQTMQIKLEPGTELTRFRINFREPYLMDKPIGFGTSLYLFERGRDGYDEERFGARISFDKKFEEGWLADWVGEIAFGVENVDVDDREAFAAKDIRDDEGNNFLSTVRLGLLHDTTNSRFEPSEGHRLRLSWEQAGVFGGDHYHAKLQGSYTEYWTVYTDDEDRKSIFSVHGRVGQIIGDAPVFERFYAGGIGSMRGFDYRGISPRDGIRQNRIGGEFMALTSAEYSFPLYTKAIRGVLFMDMGTVERNLEITTWRASIGAGIRMTLDFFGPIPMEFDFAIPVSKDGDDDQRVFSFYIGLPFF